jgi:hypothetical protein
MGGALHPLRGNCIARLIRPLPAGALAPAGGWQPQDGVVAVSGWHHKAQQLRRQVILRLRQRQLRTDTIRSNRATSEILLQHVPSDNKMPVTSAEIVLNADLSTQRWKLLLYMRNSSRNGDKTSK